MGLLEQAIGLLAPPQCVGCGDEGSALCEACLASEIIPFGARCWRCGKLSPGARTCSSCRHTGSPRSIWISTDYQGIPQKLVSAYKFGHLRVAAQDIAGVMADTFLTFNSGEMIKKAGYLVVPIPTATSRMRQRGFGHAELLAENLAVRLGLEHQNLLGRLGQRRQVGTRRDQRIKQAKDSYFIRGGRTPLLRNILLVDDVVTTGATLQAATALLRRAGAKHVDALVFAKRL